MRRTLLPVFAASLLLLSNLLLEGYAQRASNPPEGTDVAAPASAPQEKLAQSDKAAKKGKSSDSTTKPSSREENAKNRERRRSENKLLTSPREAAAVTFARRHHPELADLLVHLKMNNAAQYAGAIRELFRTSERLTKLEERDPERHDLSLQVWQWDSRVRLLAAQMTMTESAELEAELKSALTGRIDARLKLMMLDRDRLQERISKMDAAIATQQEQRDTAAEKELQRLKRSLGTQNKKKPRTVPAKKSPETSPAKTIQKKSA